jgi:hypothetical protein
VSVFFTLALAFIFLREQFTASGDSVKLAQLNAWVEQCNLNSQYTDSYPALIREWQQRLNNF